MNGKQPLPLTTIEEIFYHLCSSLNCAPMHFLKEADDTNRLELVNYSITENVAKAFVCTLPFLKELREITLVGNSMTDENLASVFKSILLC